MEKKCCCPYCETELTKACLGPAFCSPCGAEKNIKTCLSCGAHYSAEYKTCPSCSDEQETKKGE